MKVDKIIYCLMLLFSFSIVSAVNVTIDAPFTNQIGDVRENFYGNGAQFPTKLGGGWMIDTSNTGVRNVSSNTTWWRETFLEGGNTITYYDAYLENHYDGVENPDFEYWKNSTSKDITSNEERVWGWTFEGQGGSTVHSSRSTDSHSGDYSVNLTGVSGTNGILFSNWQNTQGYNLSKDYHYNVSFWVKGTGTFGLNLQEIGGSFSACGGPGTKTVFTIDSADGWQHVFYNCTRTSEQYEVRVGVDGVGVGETILIDDFELTQNGSYYNWWYDGNITPFEDAIEWSYQNNVEQMLIMDFMPRFLANRSNLCVDNEQDSDIEDCAPYNYSTFGEISTDFYKRATQGIYNSTKIFIWNEPGGSAFQDNLPNDEAKPDFVTLYSHAYDDIKNYNPGIQVMGYRGLAGSVKNETHLSGFAQMMFSNISNKFDGYSYHPYTTTYINATLNMREELINLVNQCEIYSVNCSSILLSEWHPSFDFRNESSKRDYYSLEFAYFYSQILNLFPDRLVSMYYHADDPYSYYNNPSNYNQYPAFWSGISEAGLDNPSATYYPAYNVTKDFSEFHSSGSTIYNSSTDDYRVISLSSKISDEPYITILNINQTINLTINTDEDIDVLYNLKTGERFSGQSGVFQLGESNGNEVLHLGRMSPEENYIFRWNVNENQGSTLYDAAGNLRTASISGGQWFNDGVLVSLTEGVDFTFAYIGGIFTVLTQENLFSYITASWSYSVGGFDSLLADDAAGGLMQFGNWFSIIVMVGITALILSIVFYAFRRQDGGY